MDNSYPRSINQVGYKGFAREARFIFTTILVTLVVAAISSYMHAGWKSAFALSLGMFSVIAGYAIWAKDTFLYRLLLFGIIAGLTELFADCWLVRSTGTLVYENSEPKLACSPLYMPFAWAVILVQVGYLGWLIAGHKPLWISMLATMFIGLLFIPLFEHLAKGAGWWYYKDCLMIFNTPYYIIMGEGLICMTLPLFFTIQSHKNYGLAAAFGLLQGLWIWGAYYISVLTIQ